MIFIKLYMLFQYIELIFYHIDQYDTQIDDKKYQIINYFMRRVKLFKVFHLVSDNTSSVPQKVFLKKEEFYGLSLQLQKSCKTIGLVGAVDSIKKQLICFQQKLNAQPIAQSEKREVLDFDFSLSEDEKGALYFLQLADPSIESKDNYCFIIFVAPDKFYYEKPIEQNSLLYLLTRFMGDLCSDILMLYDQKIELQFQESGCPYAATDNQIVAMKMVSRSVADIKIKKIPCNFSKLFEYDPKYSEKINLDIPIQTRYILYVQKVLQEDLEKRQKQELYRLQNYVFDSIYLKKQKDLNKIFLQGSKVNVSISKSLVQSLLNEHKIFANQLHEINQRYFNKLKDLMHCWIKQISGPSQKLQDEIYYYSVVNQVKLFAEKSSFYLKEQEHLIQSDIFSCLMSSLQITKYEELHYSEKYFFKYAIQMFKEIKKAIQLSLNYMYSSTKKSLSCQKKDQIIDTAAFQMQAINTKEGILQNISLIDYSKIEFKFKSFTEKLKIQSFSFIKNISIYDLNNSKKVKLFWMELSIEKDNQFSGILFIHCGSQIIIIKRFTKKGLKFTFNKDNEKGYLIDEVESKLSCFSVDSFYRIKDEKIFVFRKQNLKQKIISFGITIYPEILFFLIEQANCIYSYNLVNKEQLKIGKQVNSKRYLTIHQNPYEYIKTFNENIYLVIGNKCVIDVISYNVNGDFQIKQSIKMDSANFLGATIFADKCNEYLIIHNRMNSIAYAFLNMNCENVLEEDEIKDKSRVGNPILDIFHEAKQRFGDYTNHNGEIKNIRLFHLTNLESKKVTNYTNELKNINFAHQIWKKQDSLQILARIQNTWPINNLFETIQTRIPIQMCTIQDGNILPLINGKRQSSHFFDELTVAQRSKILNFGTVQDILKNELNKRVIVVSVMGAQSTGKSYLMNRVFQTRFAVASSRTTDGIWVSVVKKKDFNYLLLDCEGLFSTDRSALQQQKLVKILASLSDYTILNQNMSMNNRSLTELMDQISNSAKSLKKQSDKLYHGQLFVIVRDVKATQYNQIKQQFKRNFQNNEKKKGNEFIKRLFRGSINLFTVNHFGDKTFQTDIVKIKKHLQVQGIKKPQRNAKQILESLKILMTQLVCDDSKKFQQNFQDYQIQMGKERIINIWINGSDKNQKIQGIIFGKQINIFQNKVIVNMKQSSMKDLIIFDNMFKSKVIGQTDSELKSTDFNSVYQQFNDFIVKFFQHRKNLVEEEIIKISVNQLKQIKQQKKKPIIAELRKIIYDRANFYKLCLGKCHKCQLVCISKHGHKEDIQFEKENTRMRKIQIQGQIKIYSLSQQQILIKQTGLQELKEQKTQQLQQLTRLKKEITNYQEVKQYLNLNESQITQKREQMQKISITNSKCFQQNEKINLQTNKLIKQIVNMQQSLDSLTLKSLLVREQYFLNNQINSQFNQREAIITKKQQSDLNIKNIEQQFINIMESTKKQSQKIQQFLSEELRKISNQKMNLSIQQAKSNQEKENIQTKSIQLQEEEVKLNQYIGNKRNYCQLKEDTQKQMKRIEEEYIRIQSKQIVIKQQNKEINKDIYKLQQYVSQMQMTLSQKIYQINIEIFIKQGIEKILSINKHIRQTEDSLNNRQNQEAKRIIYKMANIEQNIPIQTLKEDIQKKHSINLRKSQKFPQNEAFKKKIAEYQQILIQCEKSGIIGKNIYKNQLNQQKRQIFKQIQNVFQQKTSQITFLLEMQEKITILKEDFQKQQSINKLKQKFKNNHHEIKQNDIWNNLIQLPLLQLNSQKQNRERQLKLEKSQYEIIEQEAQMLQIERKIIFLQQQITQIEIAIQFVKFQATEIGTRVISKQLQNIIQQFQQTQDHQILKDKSINLNQVNLSERDKLQLELQLLENTISKVRHQYEECQDQERLRQIEIQLEQHIVQQKIKHAIFSYIIYATTKLQQFIKQSYQQFKILNKFNRPNDNEIILNFQNLHLQWSNQTKGKQQYSPSEDQDQILRQFNVFLSEADNLIEEAKEQKSRFGRCLKSCRRHKKQVVICLETMLQKFNKLRLGSLHFRQVQQIMLEAENLSDLLTKVECFTINLIKSQIQIEKQKKINAIQQSNILIRQKNQSLKDETEDKLALQKISELKEQIQQKYSTLQAKIEKVVADQGTCKANGKQIRKAIDQSNQQMANLSKTIKEIQSAILYLQEAVQSKTDELQKMNTLKQMIESVNFQGYRKLIQVWEQQHLNNFDQIQSKKAKQSFLQKLLSTNQELKKRAQQLQARIGIADIQGVEKQIADRQAKLKMIQTVKEKSEKLRDLQEKRKLIIEKMEQLSNNSKQSCSCQTTHKCQFSCFANCVDKKCAKPAGHLGHHLCQESNHLCPEFCSRDPKCQKKCTQMFGHDLSVIHNCHEKHKCLIKCQFCDDICGKNKFDDHLQHCCKKKDCSFTCVLCEKKCVSQSHDHDKDTISVQIRKGGQLIKRQLHLCGDSHPCAIACSHSGICSYKYSNKTKTWKQKGSEQDYVYIEQTQIRQTCKNMIPAGNVRHQGDCFCHQEHKCDHRCPDCKSGCDLSFGHTGKHRTNHRNQQKLMYAAEHQNEEICIKSKTSEQKIKQFFFEVGDISTPTTCYQSCKRKGRGHYHLLQCQGEQDCGQRRYDNVDQGAIRSVLHSNKKYHPHIEKQYDRYLCSQYWEHCNFEMPNPQQKDEYDSCNFSCQHQHDGKQNKHLYCTKSAWHSFSVSRNDHMFECDSYHKSSNCQKIEICFLIDVTGSMERFINQCKTTIKKIIQVTSKKKSLINIQFAIIGYRDHPMSLSTINKQLRQLSIEKLNNLKIAPQISCLAQQINQSDYITKLISAEQKFRKIKSLEIEGQIIEYFEEEQQIILKYHYPFVLDIQTSQSFVQPSKLSLLLLKMLLISSDHTRSLKDYLLDDLKFYKRQIQKELKEEDQPLQALIQKKDFTNSVEILQFVDSLKANGGGDPPEAVLDGMNTILQLNWSKSPAVMKYIFHLLDAPPHGRQFGTDNGDKFPDGCPCGKKQQPIIQAIKELNASYIIYPLTPRVNKTMEIFENCGLQFKKQEINKQCPAEFTSHAVETVCSFLEQTDIMVRTD